MINEQTELFSSLPLAKAVSKILAQRVSGLLEFDRLDKTNKNQIHCKLNLEFICRW